MDIGFTWPRLLRAQASLRREPHPFRGGCLRMLEANARKAERAALKIGFMHEWLLISLRELPDCDALLSRGSHAQILTAGKIQRYMIA